MYKITMISVVIPAFNEEKFLPQCLESLKNQDYEGDYEIIVVDNGSTDNTIKIAREHGARVVLCSQRGVVHARQAGADAALGDIIVQAAADPVYPRDWLARIAKHFSSHPKSVALAGTYIYKDPPRWAWIEYFLRYFVNRMIGVPFFGRPVSVAGANFAFRREAFLKAGGYEAYSLYPDQWGISRSLSKTGKVSYDKTLSVITSSRRVQRSLPFVLAHLVLNSSRVFAHFLRHNINLLRTFTRRLPLIRTPARLGISIFLVSIITILAFGYAVPTSQVFGKVYYKERTSEKIVALTFDDGPNEPYTSEILDILDSYGIKGTFFIVGKNAELYPMVANRMLVEGHVLGNHTYTHNPNHAITDEGCHDISLAQEAIFNVVGVKPHLYRPPHGKKSPWELAYLKQHNMIGVTWSMSANDEHVIAYFGKPTPEVFAKEIISEAKPGKIILLHDGYGTNHNDTKSDRSITVKALPIIIEGLKHQGYQFVTVPELLEMPAYN